MSRLRSLLSPPMAVALLALLVALGGTSYAAVTLPRNSVGTVQLKTGAVTSVDVKDRSLRAVDLAPGQLPAGPAGPAGPVGPQGPTGAAGSDAAAVTTGQVVVPGSNRSFNLDGRVVSTSSETVATRAPAVGTVVRDFTADVSPALPAGTGRSFNLSVDGALVGLCTISAPATSCTMAPGSSVAVPAGARIALVSFFLAPAASADLMTLRWGMTFGTS